MYFLITAALAGTAGFTWGWTHHSWHMPLWLMAVFVLVPPVIADLADRAWKRRRASRPRAERRAHARPTTRHRA